jgi:succinyl-diaminopimelate desuccinylase
VTPTEQEVARQVDLLVPQMVSFTRRLVRMPTVNPPGDHYLRCARFIGQKLASLGYSVEMLTAPGQQWQRKERARVNVIGSVGSGKPVLHFNGHYDVVPASGGWSRNPFSGEVSDGRIYGRGASDQKAGIAASIYAVEAIRRAGIELNGTIEQSATADEESGGFAGVAWLCDSGRIAAGRQDYVVITEPLDPERIAIGHRGVYWFEVKTIGRVGHGSMPGLAINAADEMARLIHLLNFELKPRLAQRLSEAPVEPPEARRPSLNLNALHAGQQHTNAWQSPCVPDEAVATFDRRFIHEELFDGVKAEIVELLDASGIRYELRDLMRVDPLLLPSDSSLASTTAGAIKDALNTEPSFIASPGTFDQKHVVRRAGIQQCIGYGPGRLVLAHQPDEYVSIEDLRNTARVMAILVLRLLG